MNNVSLVVKKDTLLKLGRLDVSYDLLGLWSKKVKVRSLVIDRPEINLTKVADKDGSRIRNFDYLLKSDKEPDTSKKEFDWKIYADKFEIRNGNFRSIAEKDENVPVRNVVMRKIKSLDFDNLDVTDINLNLFG